MATLADVARHAGVAASTVSYVLSGKRSVSDETKDRVNRAIKELKYHPNAGARALASSRSNVLALVVPLHSDMYVPEDVSIVALCPDQIAEQTAPRLTSVTLPAAELGTRAVDLLMRRMGGSAAAGAGGNPAGEVQLIPPSLTARGSTGAPLAARAPEEVAE